MISPTSTRDQIVALAQTLIQTQGSNGFSYRDLAAKIGIKTSSIHYHFPQKEDLLLAAVEDYHQRWHVAIRAIDRQLPADEQLRRDAGEALGRRSRDAPRRLIIAFEQGIPDALFA